MIDTPLMEFCGFLIPQHTITGFEFKSKSIIIHLLNKGRIKQIYPTMDEARSEFSKVQKQYEKLGREFNERLEKEGLLVACYECGKKVSSTKIQRCSYGRCEGACCPDCIVGSLCKSCSKG